jgi:hypothetical protein
MVVRTVDDRQLQDLQLYAHEIVMLDVDIKKRIAEIR